MELDKTTYNDLSLLHSEEEFSVFHKLDYTRTIEGREWLLLYFKNPFSNAKEIDETQQVVKDFLLQLDQWPLTISNGTIMVLTKFYESSIDTIPSSGMMSAFNYKMFSSPDFSLVRYSLTHFADFIRGMKQLTDMFLNDQTPPLLKKYLSRAAELNSAPILLELAVREPGKPFSWNETIYFGRYLREQFKNACYELIGIFGRLDAWYSMAVAMIRQNLSFPTFIHTGQPYVNAQGLYHILLGEPVPYDIQMDKDANFIFLTGANMAGKSTFIRAVGCAVFLAHLGMGVPAQVMKLSIFDGLLSNINVVDNISKGESYFFNEVQRIRNTILKINDGRKWLVLIDELFKGTNVQDAMKCSSAVIKGLIKIKSSIFILSTHLYEIGEELKSYPNISFRYFETAVTEDQLEFSYQLKDGISNDRLGYLILKRERVVELLEKLGED